MEELTAIVSAALEARGVLPKIRAELRANVFAAIHEQAKGDVEMPLSPTLRALRAEPAGQLALGLVHELLVSCALDYSASVLVPEAQMEEAPSRVALAKQLGLAHVDSSSEPLLVTLARTFLSGAQPQRVAAAAAPSAAGLASHAGVRALDAFEATEAEVSGSGTAMGAATSDPLLADSKRPLPQCGGGRGGSGGAGEPQLLGDLPPLVGCGGGRAGRSMPAGMPPSQEESEEERRLDALVEGIESKIAGIASKPFGNPLDPASADFEDDLDDMAIEEEFGDSFEDDDEEDDEVMFGMRSGGEVGASASRSRALEQSVDESVSPGRLSRALQAFDHTETAENP